MSGEEWDAYPNDVETEGHVLGAMMLAEHVIPDVYRVLGDQFNERDTVFYRPAHWIIYRTVITMWDVGAQPDAVTVAKALQDAGALGRVGGPVKLHDLIERVPTVANAGKYAEILQDVYRRRRVAVLREALRDASPDRARELTEEWTAAEALLQGTAGGTVPGRSWQPVDLGPILRGQHKRAVPTVGVARSDGLQFLYPGKEHSVIGEMESGKSWFCLASCAAELVEGNHVLYIHFEETDPTDTVERLQLLGVSAAVMLERFRFVGPDEPVRPDLLAALLDPAPTLAVLDGVNEAMSLHGHEIRQEDGAAAFRRHLVKPCTAVGAAVLAADHVVKDREKQGRGPLGSVHKGNAVNGSLILIENAEPFGRGQRGRSHVFVTKDRPGHLRGHGRATKTPGKTFMGELVVDDTRTEWDGLSLRIWAPADRDEDTAPADPHADDDEHVLDVVRTLVSAGEVATLRAVRAKSRFGNEKTADCLTRLVIDGRLVEEPGERKARTFVPTGSGSLSGGGSS
ncbi:hypothetical protein BKA00_005817 [Actinomadura coerulea]|uniref:DNA helicase DnaB-like N-terminal domain-containing protein n=1 Tax=Actinomadura coerulea TaxID=46159 RepID=A0A7X0G3U6_9ACTN|nr:hypothetical protein [Actinomadura coerulea]GGP98387.1 hypothetical protein GCM10010187_12500 [Actinomadura coerulea]